MDIRLSRSDISLLREAGYVVIQLTFNGGSTELWRIEAAPSPRQLAYSP